VAAEAAKLAKQKQELDTWISRSEAKLSNQGFVAKAPAKVVEEAKAHLEEMKARRVSVEELLAS
jgi:valyl-tRNA synthetase